VKSFKQLVKELKENFGNSAGLIGGGQLEADITTPSERSGVLRYAPTQGQIHTDDSDDPVKMWYVQQNIKQTENIKQTINMWQNKHAHEIEFKSQQNSLVKGDKSQPGTGQPPPQRPLGPLGPVRDPGSRPSLPPDGRPPDVRPK